MKEFEKGNWNEIIGTHDEASKPKANERGGNVENFRIWVFKKMLDPIADLV